jgi:hypothetical protein
VSNPPRFYGPSCPEDRPGGTHAPVPVCEPPSKRWVICAPFASALFVAYSSRSRTERTALSTLISVSVLGCVGDHMISLERCSTFVKALAALDPAGFGLDDACAQLEGSTYVMAEETRRIVSY